MTITAYPGNVAVPGYQPPPLTDRRSALLRLTDDVDWLTGREVRDALVRLTPGLGADDDTRDQWWAAFRHAADTAAYIHERAGDAWTAMAVLDELGEEYGADPYATAQARECDWDRLVDDLVREAQA